jgi:hypothetical protein
MLVNVWLVAQDGADRIYVSTSPPPQELEKLKPTKVFRAEVEIPGYDKVDGVIRLTAEPVEIADEFFPSAAKGV